MFDYVNPVLPVVKFLRQQLAAEVSGGARIVGGMFDSDERGPALSVKLAGGATDVPNPYSRIQLLARASVDYEAMALVIKASNALVRDFEKIQDLRVITVRIETRPIDTRDGDTQLPESWCYIIIEHLEA